MGREAKAKLKDLIIEREIIRRAMSVMTERLGGDVTITFEDLYAAKPITSVYDPVGKLASLKVQTSG